MPVHPIKVTVIAGLALLLQACATAPATAPASASAAPTPDQASAAESATVNTPPAEPVPELKLNLSQTGQCNCPIATQGNPSYLDQGFDALLDGEYSDAMTLFQRYQRVESSPRADWESGIAIAYINMLPRTPFYDPQAAQAAFKTLREAKPKALKVHPYTRLMRQALLNFVVLQRQIDEAQANNATLQEDLKKREEALKRLRALTLGQKGSAP